MKTQDLSAFICVYLRPKGFFRSFSASGFRASGFSRERVFARARTLGKAAGLPSEDDGRLGKPLADACDSGKRVSEQANQGGGGVERSIGRRGEDRWAPRRKKGGQKSSGPELGISGPALREWRWEGTHRQGCCLC